MLKVKILVLSDIHANWYALEAILAKEAYDSLIFLGDAVDFGPNPRKCIRFLMNSYKGAFWGVRGDHDHAMAYGIGCGCSTELSSLSNITRDWGESILTSEEVGFLRRLPLDNRFSIDGLNFYLVHDPHKEKALRDINSYEMREFDSENECDFILIGHSHKPFIKRLGSTTVLNPGSAGQPMDFNPRASYAVIENGEATIKRIKYDIERTVRDLEKSSLPKDAIRSLVSILVVGGVVDERQYLNPS